jgi:hypothetical protein
MWKIAGKIFYAIAALFLAFAVWAFTHSAEIISEAIEIGQITIAGNLYDIINFYMANTGQYFVFAFLLAGIGILLHKTEKTIPQSVERLSATERTQNDNELDEWFNENNEEDE